MSDEKKYRYKPTDPSIGKHATSFICPQCRLGFYVAVEDNGQPDVIPRANGMRERASEHTSEASMRASERAVAIGKHINNLCLSLSEQVLPRDMFFPLNDLAKERNWYRKYHCRRLQDVLQHLSLMEKAEVVDLLKMEG